MKVLALVVLSGVGLLAPAAVSAQTVAGSDATLPSFASLFRDLPGDFANLASPESVIILGAGGGLAAAVHPRDARITRSLATPGSVEDVLDPGQFVGDGFVQAGGAFATFLVGRMTHNPRVATIGAELVRAQIVAGVLTEGIKLSVNRRRPDGNTLSFPSGHTSASFATAAVLQRELGWKFGGVAYAAATYVAISRMSENKHYASDIAFGAALGILAGRRISIHPGTHDLTLTPLAVPGGGGVGVTWTPRP
jgi:membrane-associated phospholipid phosphatase